MATFQLNVTPVHTVALSAKDARPVVQVSRNTRSPREQQLVAFERLNARRLLNNRVVQERCIHLSTIQSLPEYASVHDIGKVVNIGGVPVIQPTDDHVSPVLDILEPLDTNRLPQHLITEWNVQVDKCQAKQAAEQMATEQADPWTDVDRMAYVRKLNSRPPAPKSRPRTEQAIPLAVWTRVQEGPVDLATYNRMQALMYMRALNEAARDANLYECADLYTWEELAEKDITVRTPRITSVYRGREFNLIASSLKRAVRHSVQASKRERERQEAFDRTGKRTLTKNQYNRIPGLSSSHNERINWKQAFSTTVQEATLMFLTSLEMGEPDGTFIVPSPTSVNYVYECEDVDTLFRLCMWWGAKHAIADQRQHVSLSTALERGVQRRDKRSDTEIRNVIARQFTYVHVHILNDWWEDVPVHSTQQYLIDHFDLDISLETIRRLLTDVQQYLKKAYFSDNPVQFKPAVRPSIAKLTDVDKMPVYGYDAYHVPRA
ncbi:MAG: hypothetical protein HN929_14280 [Chloroflexi bacterium]|jgi:hypothetical protein|nr:hypothetical protein [Chloroflexota bacterium]